MFDIVVILSTVACVLGAAVPEFTFPESDGRIVGGAPTTIAKFPWQIVLLVDNRRICGGSVIHESFVLTAAHCIQPQVTTDRYSVRVGSTFWYAGGTVRKVDNVTVHKDFDRQTIQNDIAIMKLITPVKFSNHIQPIPLATVSPPNGDQAAVSGWGATKNGGSYRPPELRYAIVNVIDKNHCIADSGYGSRIKNGMICAQAPNKDACQGDSGGPLEAGGKLIGIVSWGIGCALQGYPGVYTDVSKFREWVLRNINI